MNYDRIVKKEKDNYLNQIPEYAKLVQEELELKERLKEIDQLKMDYEDKIHISIHKY